MCDWNEILGWFSEDPATNPEPYEIIYAEYDGGGYEGWSHVLYWDKGKFYYNYGSHCSCYGLEEQWGPEEYSVETLKGQIERASYGFFKDQKELIMEAITKYESPLATLAADYARAEAELKLAEGQYADAEEKVSLARKNERELRIRLKALLN